MTDLILKKKKKKKKKKDTIFSFKKIGENSFLRNFGVNILTLTFKKNLFRVRICSSSIVFFLQFTFTNVRKMF